MSNIIRRKRYEFLDTRSGDVETIYICLNHVVTFREDPEIEGYTRVSLSDSSVYSIKMSVWEFEHTLSTLSD